MGKDQAIRVMEPHGQSPWYLHEIPSYAKASEGYPPVAKSAEASILRHMNNSATAYAFIHGQSPWSSPQADKFIPLALYTFITKKGLSKAPFLFLFLPGEQLFTLLLHKDPVELPQCLYKEPVYSLLMIPFKSHRQSDLANDIELRPARPLARVS